MQLRMHAMPRNYNLEEKAMKNYAVRLSFTDRRFGPGTGRSINVEAGNPAGALGKATREFWKSLNTKQRNDARRSGLKAEAYELTKSEDQ